MSNITVATTTSSEYFTPEELYVFWLGTFHPLNWVNLFMSALAIIACYAFPKQRKFPTCLIGWVAMVDFGFNLTMVIKWSPFSYFHKLWVLEATAGSPACNIGVAFDTFFTTGTPMTNTFLALALFITIYMGKCMDPQTHPWYRRSFILSYWIVTVALAIGSGLAPTTVLAYCASSSIVVVICIMVPWCLLVLVQAVLLTLTYIRLLQVGKAADVNLQKRRKDLVIYLRFAAIILTQIVVYVVPFAAYVKGLQGKQPTAGHYKALAYMNQLGYLIESIIILAGNRSLREWIRSQIDRDHKRGSKGVSATTDAGASTPASTSSTSTA